MVYYSLPELSKQHAAVSCNAYVYIIFDKLHEVIVLLALIFC